MKIANQSIKSCMLAAVRGVVICVLATLCLTAITALLMSYEVIDADRLPYAAMVILSISAFVGSWSAKRRNAKLLVSVACITGYSIVLLLINALIYDGAYSGIGATLLLIWGFGLLPVLLTNRIKNRNRNLYITRK